MRKRRLDGWVGRGVAAMTFEIGQSVGDYEILGVLGNGGMGCVYRVRNVISDRVEAMKVVLADLVAEAGIADRFIGEIRTLARLDHPNIAKFFTAFKFENQLVMIMEYIQGFTLANQATQSPLPVREALTYMTQILSALSYAHERGVIHRDIKPANVMVTPEGVLKLMDFGIAKSSIEPLVTRTGITIGSMLYMSPEQVRGTAVDARSDLYSVGVLLYELTAGRRPFEGETTFAILEQQVNTMPEPPIKLNPSLPPALSEIIITALAKDPSHRFQNAEAFRNALRNVSERDPAVDAPTLVNSPVLNSPGPTGDAVPQAALSHTPPQKSRRSLWMASGAIASICVLAAAAIIVPHFWRSLAANRPGTSTLNATAKDGHLPQATQQAPDLPPATSAQDNASPATPPVLPLTTSALNQTDNGDAQISPKDGQTPPLTSQKQIPHTARAKISSATPATSQAVPPAPVAQPEPTISQPVAAQTDASQQALDTLGQDLVRIHARADAVKSSLDRLRAQQAASGFGLRQDIVASASRLDAYLQAVERDIQSNAAPSAQKNLDRASAELTILEAFLGNRSN
jgi:serine/threonine protein kinase